MFSFQVGDYHDSSIGSELVTFLVSKVNSVKVSYVHSLMSYEDLHTTIKEFLTKPSQQSQEVNLHHINYQHSRQPQPYSGKNNNSMIFKWVLFYDFQSMLLQDLLFLFLGKFKKVFVNFLGSRCTFSLIFRII